MKTLDGVQKAAVNSIYMYNVLFAVCTLTAVVGW